MIEVSESKSNYFGSPIFVKVVLGICVLGVLSGAYIVYEYRQSEIELAKNNQKIERMIKQNTSVQNASIKQDPVTNKKD